MNILVVDSNNVWLTNAKTALECAGKHKIHTKTLSPPSGQKDCELARKIVGRESEVFNPGADVMVIGKSLSKSQFAPYLLALMCNSFKHIVACGNRQPFMVALGIISVPFALSELAEIIGEIEMKSRGSAFEEICRDLGLTIPEVSVSSGGITTAEIPRL